MQVKQWIVAVSCVFVAPAAPVWAQAGEPQQRQQTPQAQPQAGQQPQSQQTPQAQPQAGQPQPKQLSQKSQQALARLHALNLARAKFANVAADMADHEDVKEFMQTRAREYEQADRRLSAFASMYNVDMESEKMQRTSEKTLQQWQKENQKIQKAKREEAGRMAIATFLERNDEAISDLRQLRGDIQEPELRELVNDRIAALEQESTRAQEIQQELRRQQQKQGQ